MKAAPSRRHWIDRVDEPLPFLSPVSLSVSPSLSLSLSRSLLFISLTSLAGYMLLIKHAALLLIVNQIQFVPQALHE